MTKTNGIAKFLLLLIGLVLVSNYVYSIDDILVIGTRPDPYVPAGGVPDSQFVQNYSNTRAMQMAWQERAREEREKNEKCGSARQFIQANKNFCDIEVKVQRDVASYDCSTLSDVDWSASAGIVFKFLQFGLTKTYHENNWQQCHIDVAEAVLSGKQACINDMDSFKAQFSKACGHTAAWSGF